jgi:hypothetical protein
VENKFGKLHAKSHLKQYALLKNPSKKEGGPRASSVVCGSLGPLFYAIDKANIITDCLENQFRVYDLCD